MLDVKGGLPRWALVAVLITIAMIGGCTVLLIVAGAALFSPAADLDDQCRQRIPDPSATTRPGTRTTTTTATTTMTTTATTNPYAQTRIVGDSAWERACLAAMRDGPRQGAPITVTNQSAAAQCAQRLATALTELPPQPRHEESGERETETIDAAELVRYITFHAARVADGERCGPSDDGPTQPTPAALTPVSGKGSCSEYRASEPLLLPDTVSEQAWCGQRVEPAAVSPGDLVFWDYRDYTATEAGVAISTDEIVTADTESGRYTRRTIPTGVDVRVFRILPGPQN